MEPVDLSDLESTISTGTKTRGELLAPHARGGLAHATTLLSGSACAAIVTGFSVPTGSGFAPETDGPPGAAMLAAYLAGSGIQSRLITDEQNLGVCEAALSPYSDLAMASDCAPDVVSFTNAEIIDSEVLLSIGADLLIFIERLGPNRDGNYLSMRGIDLTSITPRLDRLITPGLSTIGIGDGGNEIGMGGLPGHAVEQLANGSAIHCVIPTDALIVAGVSNWGASALVAALGSQDPAHLDVAIDCLNPERFERCLNGMALEGAVDGCTGRNSLSVDGMDCDIHKQMLTAIACCLERE